jgi:hypothetical protein
MRTTDPIEHEWRVLVLQDGTWTEDMRGTHAACWDRFQLLADGGEERGDVALCLQAPRAGARSEGR